jgi:hypothetical protein
MSSSNDIVDESTVLQISSSESKPATKQGGCCEYIRSQDFSQKIGIIPTVAFEIYRVVISTCLILFVPQKCEDHVCELKENLVLENKKYTAGVVINFITLASFLALYFVEVRRENTLINYLEVSANVASDNVSVGKTLELLPKEKQVSIHFLDKCYQRGGFFIIFLFLTNAILSGFVVSDYYLDKQTTSTFVTNILFIITKLIDIYTVANTEDNIFYSAYLKGRIQYNDVDPDKRMPQITNSAAV